MLKHSCWNSEEFFFLPVIDFCVWFCRQARKKKESHGTNSSVLSIGYIIIHVAIGAIRSCCMMSSTICIEWSFNTSKPFLVFFCKFGFLFPTSNGLGLIFVLLWADRSIFFFPLRAFLQWQFFGISWIKSGVNYCFSFYQVCGKKKERKISVEDAVLQGFSSWRLGRIKDSWRQFSYRSRKWFSGSDSFLTVSLKRTWITSMDHR